MTNHEGTVLIVDDNSDTCASLSMLVMLEGFAPVVAANGAIALTFLQDHPPPCIIILDMAMPVMDGFEFLARKRQLAHACRVPVLIASGQVRTIDLDHYPDVVCVVFKPACPDKIFSILKRYHVSKGQQV